MGSIASHPKVPSAAQTVYVPVYTPPASTTTPTTSDPTTPTGENPATPTRASSLLDRSRGVLSTVLTGFRGILSDGNTPKRKTLLGE